MLLFFLCFPAEVNQQCFRTNRSIALCCWWQCPFVTRPPVTLSPSNPSQYMTQPASLRGRLSLLHPQSITTVRCRVIVLLIVSSCISFTVFSFVIASNNKKVCAIVGCHVTSIVAKISTYVPMDAILRNISAPMCCCCR